MRKTVVFALALTPVLVSGCWAQLPQLSFGATGGVPITDLTTGKQESRRYTIGPSVEARFTDHFAVEFDALYKRLGTTNNFQTSAADGLTSYTTRHRANSWEFPLLGKFYFSGRDSKIQPFLGSGWAFRKMWIDSQTTSLSPNSVISTDSLSRTSDTGVGAVFSGGVRIGQGRLSFVPEFRYTRWGGQDFPTARNQVDFLLGVRF